MVARRLKVAVIGTGISGNYAAWKLNPDHDITVFEAQSRIGGHTNTIQVPHGDRELAIDTGFIVFNDVTYPNFIAMLDELGVQSQESVMSFSVRCENTGLEYNGANLNTLFAQRKNLVRPAFWRMIRDILRFNREAPALLEQDADQTLENYLSQNRYSREFINHYIIPMGAAIWSASPQGMGSVPAGFFVRFFHNHGLLSISDRPRWRVISGGSAQYLDKLVRPWRHRIRTGTPVERILRFPGHVLVKAAGCPAERFDKVFIATHSDQALKMLADATPREQQVLGSIAYQKNEAVLHTDQSLMPRKHKSWAAWNYHLLNEKHVADRRVALTYNMNILQSLPVDKQYLVTLNNTSAIHPEKVIRTIQYEHPVFTSRAVDAQQKHRLLNGERHTYYCGAYWRYGFHEDGVVSAKNALEHFESDTANPLSTNAAA